MAIKKKVTNEQLGETFDFVRGYTDESGTTHKDFELREMNGSDEEAISKPEIKSNGAKIGRTLLERCCLRIGTIYKSEVKSQEWREIIQSLSVGDQDIMLLRLREISLGDEIETQYECADKNCKAKITTIISVDELEIIPYNGQDLIDFELPKGLKDKDGNLITKGKLRLPNGLDREVLDGVIRKNQGLANTMMLTRCIVELEGTKVHDDFVRNLSIKDRNYLSDLIKENSFGVSTTVDVDCPNCGESFKASLNAVNFI